MPFKKGKSGNPQGRKAGTPNKVTGALKDAILLAAEIVGKKLPDSKEHGGLVTWLVWLAVNHPPVFAQLVGKVLPLQVQGDPDKPIIPPGSAFAFVVQQIPGSENQT